MISTEIQKKIISIWDAYVNANKVISDPKGIPYGDLNFKRTAAIGKLVTIISSFQAGDIDLAEFKTKIDSFNKQNNYWGFTSIKGQMFFNLLTKTCENEAQTYQLTAMLKRIIREPHDLSDALQKISELEVYVAGIFSKATDKRKAPNPASVGYFVSYFWQIHDHRKWPIMYNSMIQSFIEIGLWQLPKSQKEAFNAFYTLNEEIRQLLSVHAGEPVSNWDAEHAFWNFNRPASHSRTESQPAPAIQEAIVAEATVTTMLEATFDIYEYIPPVTAKLVELGKETEMPGAAKGHKYEKVVGEIFKQLGFTVDQLGQGAGREPDLIAELNSEHVAFIVDAKAYANGYMMSAADDRAIRDYINFHCHRLQGKGIQKTGFIIVSNAFKSTFEEFISDITWRTGIKRFILLTSDALLHLLAYRLKDQKTTQDIIELLVRLGPLITAQDIIQQFDDV